MSGGRYQGGLAGHVQRGQELDGVHLDGAAEAAVVVGGCVPPAGGGEVPVPPHHQQFTPLAHQDAGVVCQGGLEINHPGTLTTTITLYNSIGLRATLRRKG